MRPNVESRVNIGKIIIFVVGVFERTPFGSIVQGIEQRFPKP